MDSMQNINFHIYMYYIQQMDHPCAHGRYLVFRDAVNLRSRTCGLVTWLLSRLIPDHESPENTSDQHHVCSDTRIAQSLGQDANQPHVHTKSVVQNQGNCDSDIEKGQHEREHTCTGKGNCGRRRDSDIEQGSYGVHHAPQVDGHVNIHSSGAETWTSPRNQPLFEVQCAPQCDESCKDNYTASPNCTCGHAADVPSINQGYADSKFSLETSNISPAKSTHGAAAEATHVLAEISTCVPGAKSGGLGEACSTCKTVAEADLNTSDLGHTSEAENDLFFEDFFSRQVSPMCMCVPA
jgi:hypothetical protein